MSDTACCLGQPPWPDMCCCRCRWRREVRKGGCNAGDVTHVCAVAVEDGGPVYAAQSVHGAGCEVFDPADHIVAATAMMPAKSAPPACNPPTTR